jgi:hypothetical protein
MDMILHKVGNRSLYQGFSMNTKSEVEDGSLSRPLVSGIKLHRARLPELHAFATRHGDICTSQSREESSSSSSKKNSGAWA